MMMELQPTFNLRWIRIHVTEVGIRHPTAIRWGDTNYYHVLQQQWTDTYGKSEWRDLPVNVIED